MLFRKWYDCTRTFLIFKYSCFNTNMGGFEMRIHVFSFVFSFLTFSVKAEIRKVCCFAKTSSGNNNRRFYAENNKLSLASKGIINIYNCTEDYSIQTLDLDENLINEFDKDVLRAAFPNLESLVMWRNKLKVLTRKGQGQMRKLKLLDISENLVAQIEKGFFDAFPKLENLNIQKNDIVDLPEGVFQNLYQINRIDMSYNKIQSLRINWFDRNEKLTTLIITNNVLSSWKPLDFDWLKSLRKLNLSTNKLPGIPPFPTINMNGEWQVDLRHNPIWCHCRLASHTEIIVRKLVACGLWMGCQNGNSRIEPGISMYYNCTLDKEEKRLEWLRNFTRKPLCKLPKITRFASEESSLQMLNKKRVSCTSTGYPGPDVSLWREELEIYMRKSDPGSKETFLEIIEDLTGWRNMSCVAKSAFGEDTLFGAINFTAGPKNVCVKNKFNFAFYSALLSTFSLLLACIFSVFVMCLSKPTGII